MSTTLRYDYDLPWRGVALGVVFNLGISFLMVHWAIRIGGILSIGPMFLGVVFVLLALWMIVRRVFFSRVLELTDDAILFPRGFSGKQIVRVAFSDILRMRNTGVFSGMQMVTTKGHFEILPVRLGSIEKYNNVRAFICSKTSLSLSDEVIRTWDAGWVPGPVLKWSEPENFVRYRNHLAASKPLWLRLFRTIRFLACAFGFFFIPWFALNYFLSAGLPASSFLDVLIPAVTFFTLLYWLFNRYPARVSHITVFPDGFSQLSGKQTRSFGFGDFLGWQVIERKFKEHVFHILLLQRPKYVLGIAFPDTDTRDQFVQMLNEKKIPQLSNLKPSWELKT